MISNQTNQTDQIDERNETNQIDQKAVGSRQKAVIGNQTNQTNFFPVESFVEKPDLMTAKRYVEDGHYFWNSGMFAFNIRTIKEEFQRHVPGIYEMLMMPYDRDDSPIRSDAEYLHRLCGDGKIGQESHYSLSTFLGAMWDHGIPCTRSYPRMKTAMRWWAT